MKRKAATIPWQPPTRRAFLAMIAAALVATKLPKPPPKKPIWIGHC